MATIALAEAKARLSQLVDNTLDGMETVITRHGRPVARLVPVGRIKTQRFGALKGKLDIPDDFDKPLTADEQALFEGGD